MSKASRKFSRASRDGTRFAALPFDVLDSAAFLSLSHPARSLLLELLRQVNGQNNGALLLTQKVLKPRGWTSVDTIQRARDDLLRVGLLHQTVQGRKPSWASWYALTFLALDRLEGFDPGAAAAFERGAYRRYGQADPLKNASGPPPDGVERPKTAPSGGVGERATTPPDGAQRGQIGPSTTPPDGIHIAKPSPQAAAGGAAP